MTRFSQIDWSQNSNCQLKDGVVKGHSKLKNIQIKNLGVIESSSLDFNDGFTALTGETGAGKLWC